MPSPHLPSGEPRPAPDAPRAAMIAEARRLPVLQAVTDRLDAEFARLGLSFLGGEGDTQARIALDAGTELEARMQPGRAAFLRVFQADPAGRPPTVPAGEFRLRREADGRFTLYDRLVAADARGRGLGSLLLHAAERFALAATAPDQAPGLRAEIGQGYLMDWFERRGFVPEDPGALEAVRAELAAGALIVGENGYLYRAGTPRLKQMDHFLKGAHAPRVAMAKRLTRGGSAT